MNATEKFLYDNARFGTGNSREAIEKIATYLEAVVADPEELSHLLKWLNEMRYVYHSELEHDSDPKN